MELWKSLKDVVECGDFYEISNLGNIRSIDRKVNSRNCLRTVKGTVLKPNTNKDGYRFIIVSMNGSYKRYLMHRLVALAFIDNPENKPVVNHIDGNKSNNTLVFDDTLQVWKGNLEWATKKENTRHAVATGLLVGKKGEENPNSRFSDETAIEIFNKYKTNKYSLQELADEYNSSLAVLSSIVAGKSRKHLNLGVHKRDMSFKSIITDSLVKKVKELFDKGYSKRKIERETGVSRTTVTNILDNY